MYLLLQLDQIYRLRFWMKLNSTMFVCFFTSDTYLSLCILPVPLNSYWIAPWYLALVTGSLFWNDSLYLDILEESAVDMVFSRSCCSCPLLLWRKVNVTQSLSSFHEGFGRGKKKKGWFVLNLFIDYYLNNWMTMVSLFQHVADVNTVFVLVPIFVSPHVALRNFNIRCRSLGFFFFADCTS